MLGVCEMYVCMPLVFAFLYAFDESRGICLLYYVTSCCIVSTNLLIDFIIDIASMFCFTLIILVIDRFSLNY